MPIESNCKNSSKPLRFEQCQNKINKEGKRNNARDHVQQIHDLSSNSRSQTTIKPYVSAKKSTKSPIKIKSLIYFPIGSSIWFWQSKRGQGGRKKRQEKVKIVTSQQIPNMVLSYLNNLSQVCNVVSKKRTPPYPFSSHHQLEQVLPKDIPGWSATPLPEARMDFIDRIPLHTQVLLKPEWSRRLQHMQWWDNRDHFLCYRTTTSCCLLSMCLYRESKSWVLAPILIVLFSR